MIGAEIDTADERCHARRSQTIFAMQPSETDWWRTPSKRRNADRKTWNGGMPAAAELVDEGPWRDPVSRSPSTVRSICTPRFRGCDQKLSATHYRRRLRNRNKRFYQHFVPRGRRRRQKTAGEVVFNRFSSNSKRSDGKSIDGRIAAAPGFLQKRRRSQRNLRRQPARDRRGATTVASVIQSGA